MGNVQLGALLGSNQSFESFNTLPDAWEKRSEQSSFFQVGSPSQVHSSNFGLSVFADSSGGSNQIIGYDYGGQQDVDRVRFPAVDTHHLVSWIWARATDAPSSGQVRWRLAGDQEALSPPFTHAGSLQRYEAITVVQSAVGVPTAGATRTLAANSGATCVLDDALTQIDPLLLQPDWTQLSRERLSVLYQRSGKGRLNRHHWGSAFECSMPLRWLSDSEAALLNWWWESQLNLALTLDTSDAGSTVICRIVNATQPAGQRLRPYADRWSGRLELAGINGGGLEF